MMNRIVSFFLIALTAVGGVFDLCRPGKELRFAPENPAVERDPEKYRGVSSRVADLGGVPTLFINGEPFPAAAYMTYLEEYNDYAGFAAEGYRLFSVPVLFAGRWISATEKFKPFHAGIFDRKGEPDFSTLDASIGRILAACPDAFIIPRVNVSMPKWWIEENPDCLDGSGVRESLFSESFVETAEEMLRETIAHVDSSAYASHVAGYQIAGGNTEEWFHFDLNGGLGECAERAFNDYLAEHYPGCGFSGLPDLAKLKKKGLYHKDEHLARYLEFASNAVAADICRLAAAAKDESGGNVVIGAFYGYSLEVTSSLYGTHALKTVLECDDIDFISSPNSYVGTRDFDADWTEMYAADSVRLHGKLCMQECDVRTHLTRLLSDAAPEYDEGNNMNAPIWHGLEKPEDSVSMVRKSFCRQLVKGNGFWWFDMWGGWYADPVLRGEMGKMRSVYEQSLAKEKRKSPAEVAVFIDESAYKYLTDGGVRNVVYDQRTQLGFMGAPYDLYDVSDFEAVYTKYKAIIFLSGLRTEYMSRALELCKKERVRYISTSSLKKRYSADELRAFCESRGAHIYCRTDDVVYVGDNYVAIHASSAGEKTVTLKKEAAYRELLTDGGARGRSDTIRVTMKDNETKLFEITEAR